MSTASTPDRFWGVVALALNSVLQPAGQICEGTDSPALRLSPPFQIANALGLIYHSVRLSFAIDLPFRIAVGVVAERAGLYYNRSGITEPERHFFFRALVFIFGALPALIKALAIQGDRVSYALALDFFIPFVVLELIERLAKRPTLARLAEATRMPAEKGLAVIVFKYMVVLLASSIHIDFCLETVNLALTRSMFEVELFKMNRFIARFSPLAAAVGSMSLKIYESAPKDTRSQLVVLILGTGSIILLHVSFLEIIRIWGRWSEIATTVLTIAIAITGTFAHLFVYLRFTSTTLHQLFSGENMHKQKFVEQWIALWTVTCTFLYYGYLYDASGTYKPAWTEWLP
ncbi:MAG: hypothetical protein Q9190_002207 [Brigantiaea leucoxantha]